MKIFSAIFAEIKPQHPDFFGRLPYRFFERNHGAVANAAQRRVEFVNIHFNFSDPGEMLQHFGNYPVADVF
jgi:hypothetical protein